MINLETALTIGFGTGSTVVSTQTNNLAAFADGNTFDAATSNFMRINYTKAIHSVFVYITVPAAAPVSFSIVGTGPTRDGTTNIPINNLVDGTNGFTQSGFISWTVQQDAYLNFQAAETFMYDFTFGSFIGATLGGINLLFCDKFDLLREYPNLNELLELGTNENAIDTKLIRLMESTRDTIENNLRNSDIRKQDRQNRRLPTTLDRWDLLQLFQVRQAAVFLTLGKIFSFLADNPGDVYFLKAADYRARGESLWTSTDLSLDLNDDGSLDIYEGERNYENIEITLER